MQPLAKTPNLGRVVVFGSANLDTIHCVRELPQPGETVLSTSSTTGLGGKGANQAVAAARAGAAVRFLGAVGDDGAAVTLMDAFSRAGVDTDSIEKISQTPSGSATIMVDDHAQNAIVVSSGANAQISAVYAHSVSAVLEDCDILVAQGEVPPAATAAALSIAARQGTRVVLNLAPVIPIDDLTVADPLIVNEIEVGQLLGETVGGVEGAKSAATRLLGRCRSVIVTLGANGAVLATPTGATHVAAPSIQRALDTTGAGDAFVGVLSAALAMGSSLLAATEAAVAAATQSVLVQGAAESYPDFRPFIDEAKAIAS